MIVLVDYASPSLLESTRDATTVGLSTNLRRCVRFHGVVRQHGFILRIALRALGEAIWSDDTWVSQSDLLDPVITVHRDRIFFEAFSQDQSAYVALIVDPAVFEPMGEVVCGTTNIDFTAWLWGALGELRTSRATTFRIGPEGLDVRTSGAGGRFEKKVDLPDAWVRGFLQVQAAMGMPGTRISVKPIDLLSAVRFLRFSKAKVSPRGIRYEFEPGQDARLGRAGVEDGGAVGVEQRDGGVLVAGGREADAERRPRGDRLGGLEREAGVAAAGEDGQLRAALQPDAVAAVGGGAERGRDRDGRRDPRGERQAGHARAARPGLRAGQLLGDAGRQLVEGEVSRQQGALAHQLALRRLAAGADDEVRLGPGVLVAEELAGLEAPDAHRRAGDAGAAEVEVHGSSSGSGRVMSGKASRSAPRAEARKSRSRLRTVGRLRSVASAISACVSSSTK